MKILPLSAFLLAATLSGSASAGLVVDGNLHDWQINQSTWVSALPNVHSTVEDTTGGSNAFLNPGYGGQAYDAEALYATFQDDKLFIALITGHDPATKDNPGKNTYAAGDFAIDFGKDGSYDLGINIVSGFGVAGGVYSNPVWAYGLWGANGSLNAGNPDKSHPTSLLGGTLVGMSDFDYSKNGAGGWGVWKNDKHYFYEISVDLDVLRAGGWDGDPFNIHWTENCANDAILTDPGLVVPEPGSLALVGVGMLGLLGGGLRRRSIR